jgi:FtsH-binding integral membrane protein
MGVSLTGTLVRTGEERATLVRRTYGLVFASVVVTILSVFFATTSPVVMEGVRAHPFLMIIGLFGSLIMAQRVAPPANLALVGVFTALEGLFLAPYLAMAEQATPGITAQAGMLTLSTFGVLTLYAVVSRRDFSAWGSFFVVGLWVLIASSLLNIFFPSSLGSLWIAAGTILVFSGLLVFDTWRIVRSGQYGQDDYVPAALSIYLDLLNLFLGIIRLLGGNRR